MNPDATYGCDIATIILVIERSSIVVSTAAERLPAGYEQVDVAILRWIAAEGRRSRHAGHLTN
jgi:hypothetical protein